MRKEDKGKIEEKIRNLRMTEEGYRPLDFPSGGRRVEH